MGKARASVTLTRIVAMAMASSVLIAPRVASADAVEGKAIAEDRQKGNCLACHLIEGANLPGNIGPALIAMKARFPDRARLTAQIHDATQFNPNSLMPPFGKHGVLSEEEIDKVVDYLLTL